MSGRGTLFALLAFVAACGDAAPIVGPAPSVRVVVNDSEVELGRAFPLWVVRVWKNGADEPEWSDERLSPLTVRLTGTGRRENAALVEETRRYRAYAFALGRVTVPALSDLDAPIRLRVRPALDPREPGPVELPVGLVDEPVRWPLFLGAAVVALLALGVVVLRRRSGAEPEVAGGMPAEAPPDPREVVLAVLAALRDRDPRTAEEIQVFYRESVEALRGFLGESRDLHADRMTSEELIALSTGEAARSRLVDALGHCDVVRFARHQPAEGERGRMLDSAEAFVREVEHS